MQCHLCGADTKVSRTRDQEQGRSVMRVRRCEGPIQHVFTTQETHRITWDQVRVRRYSGSLVLFDHELLLKDVREAVMRRLTIDQTRTFVWDTIKRLEVRLPEIAAKPTAAERLLHPHVLAVISDVEIGAAMANRLRTGKDRLAHVLYAMSILGREDRGHPFRTAGDVLRWLYQPENYPDLATVLPEPILQSATRWIPDRVAPQPRSVVKRSGERKPFLRHQFIASIRRGLLGRRNAAAKSQVIAEWVLHGVWGQTEVHSHQLAVGVLDCFRRFDDIAYLRWATIYKVINSVTRFHAEARELLTSPSPRLILHSSSRHTVVRTS